LTLPIDNGQRAAGIYRFTWSGKDVTTGAVQPEGKWRLTVTATDDRAQVSTADRFLDLNNTLGSLAVQPSSLRLGQSGTRLTASFSLSRPAKVTATIETAKEIVVRVLTRASFDAGSYALTWNGRDGAGRLAYGGSYQVHVVAMNDTGRVDLRAPFTARR